MRATRLMDYWKGADGYCRSYVLITKKYTLDDIIYCGKEVVLFGWFPEAAQALQFIMFVKWIRFLPKNLRMEFRWGMDWY